MGRLLLAMRIADCFLSNYPQTFVASLSQSSLLRKTRGNVMRRTKIRMWPYPTMMVPGWRLKRTSSTAWEAP